MNVIFLKELKRSQRSLILWCAVIGLTALFGILEFPIMADYGDIIGNVLNVMPKMIQIIFGVYGADLTTIMGYYVVMYYWFGLIVFTHAIYLGASIISKEQRDKTAEYIFTKPYRRDTIVTAKILVAVVNLFIVAAIVGAISMFAMAALGVGSGGLISVMVSIIGMFVTQLVLTALGFLCSAIFKKYKFAVVSSIAVLIVSYITSFAIQYSGTDSYLSFLSPLSSYDVKRVADTGLNPLYLIVSAAIIMLSLYFTLTLYRKRDFHT
jgi:ABC-2 type transport system permease protein